MEPLLVLFDVDGTLVTLAGAGRRALEEAFRRVLGVTGMSSVAGGVRFEGKTDPVIIAEMAAAAGLDGGAGERRATELREAYLAALREDLARPDPRRRVLPGVVPLLEELQTRPGVFLGLLTGNIEAGARAKLGVFGLNRYFPGGGFSSDHPDRREIARIAREKLSRLAGIPFPPERVAVVGDTVQDILCARANGYRAIAVEFEFVSRERLQSARPDALLAGLADSRATMEALGLAGSA